MATNRDLPNFHHLTVSERVIWKNYQKDYLLYFDHYSCETANYGAMKAAVKNYITDKLEALTYDSSAGAAELQRFYLYANRHYEEDLNLLMDIYLLDTMWDWGNHIEANRVEVYIMYKYGPY
ncbi:hypothetical protein CRE_19130 [Caenorhabditis remanei]|uniref:Uncharacterized protein n=1 Tax=Caenorhabditis remanei TaxID=31234 RepID=E3MJG8_CAERE|nr:hypothetical protein CRE_19130 [Caenorhabditis remanei]